jgi:hypothetical protein
MGVSPDADRGRFVKAALLLGPLCDSGIGAPRNTGRNKVIYY